MTEPSRTRLYFHGANLERRPDSPAGSEGAFNHGGEQDVQGFVDFFALEYSQGARDGLKGGESSFFWLVAQAISGRPHIWQDHLGERIEDRFSLGHLGCLTPIPVWHHQCDRPGVSFDERGTEYLGILTGV